MSTKYYRNKYYEYIHFANGTKYLKHAHCSLLTALTATHLPLVLNCCVFWYSWVDKNGANQIKQKMFWESIVNIILQEYLRSSSYLESQQNETHCTLLKLRNPVIWDNHWSIWLKLSSYKESQKHVVETAESCDRDPKQLPPISQRTLSPRPSQWNHLLCIFLIFIKDIIIS